MMSKLATVMVEVIEAVIEVLLGFPWESREMVMADLEVTRERMDGRIVIL